MAARREGGVWVNDSGEPATIVVNPDGTATGGAVVRSVDVELTRPSNTTAYTAHDEINATVAGYLTFSDAVSVAGASAKLVKARLATSKKDVTPRIRLHLFHTAPSGQSDDNAAFRFLYADRDKEIGYIDFPALLVGTDTTNSTAAKSQNLELYLPFVSVGTDLYGRPETLDDFTPASGQTFWFELTFE